MPGSLIRMPILQFSTGLTRAVTAFGTIDAREPVVRIAAFEEALDDALLIYHQTRSDRPH